MKTVALTCIGCPLGCPLTVEIDAQESLLVTGNRCKIGENYARKELTNPTRIVTSTVKVRGGQQPLVSVKTEKDIPKSKIYDCIRQLKTVEIEAPITIGQVIVPDVAQTGVAIIATRPVEKQQ